MIANYVRKMVKNAPNVNQQTANQTHNNQNVFASTINMKINKQKSVNFVILTKIALLANLNNLINASNVIFKNISKRHQMMVSVYVKDHILLMMENAIYALKLWWIANFVIQSKNVFCAKMKIILTQILRMGNVFVMKNGFLLIKHVNFAQIKSMDAWFAHLKLFVLFVIKIYISIKFLLEIIVNVWLNIGLMIKCVNYAVKR